MMSFCVGLCQVIVVYTEDLKGTVTQTIVRGPTVFVPEVNQWLHAFAWCVLFCAVLCAVLCCVMVQFISMNGDRSGDDDDDPIADL